MGFNIGKIANTASTILSVANLAGTIGNMDLSKMNPNNLGSIKGTITSALNGNSNKLMSELQSSISVGDIESMTKGLDIEGQAKQMESQLHTSTMDTSKIEAMVNQSMDQSQIENMFKNSNLNFSQIKIM
jgi:hypothetical protein